MTTPRLTCEHCGEVIGVYEPMVIVNGAEVRETSRAAEPTIGSQPGKHYHRACYLKCFGPQAA